MNQPRPPSSAPRHPDAGDASSGESAGDPSAGSGLAGSVWELMSGFVRSHDPSDELRHTLGLGRGTGRVKALISLAGGPLSLAQVAQAIGADASYTTIIVNELQALGLLSRTPDARDRRKKTVKLTADGREASRKAQAIIVRPPSLLRDLPPADLLRLQEILGQLSTRGAGQRDHPREYRLSRR
jgi:DNA-binding MarR family transcriptional regulator